MCDLYIRYPGSHFKIIFIKNLAITALSAHSTQLSSWTEIQLIRLRAFQNDHGLPGIKVHARDQFDFSDRVMCF